MIIRALKNKFIKKMSGTSHRRYFIQIFVMICLSIFFVGCIYSHTRVVGLEPQAKQIDKTKYKVIGEAEGKTSSFNLLWLIPVTPRINYDKAVSEAVSSLKGDSLIEVRTWLKRQIWIFGTIDVLYVKGKVIL